MQLLWVYCVGSRSRRLRHPLLPKAGDTVDGALVHSDPWFHEDLEFTRRDVDSVLCLPEGTSCTADDFEPLMHKVLGIVLVRGGPVYDPNSSEGVLALLSPQQKVVERYVCNIVRRQGEEPRYEVLEVLQAVELERPIAAAVSEFLGPTRHQFFELTSLAVARILSECRAVRNHPRFGGALFKDVVSELSREFDVPSGDPKVAMGLPAPHALLVGCGLWKHYAMLIPSEVGPLCNFLNFHLVRPLLNCPTPKRRHRRRQCAELEPFPEDPGAAESLTFSLQDVADALRNALAVERRALAVGVESQREQADLLCWLERVGRDAKGCRQLHTEVVSGTWQWRIAYLLQHVVLSLELRAAASFYRVLRSCLAAVMPEVWCSTFLQLLENTPRPRRATLYFHRLTLHAGFLLHSQRHIENIIFDKEGRAIHFVTYITCDSSPQGKRDWLMTMICRVPIDRLVEAFEAARTLWMTSDSDDIAAAERADKALQVLQQALRWEVLSPVVIGSGRASAKHKMKALMWALRMSSSWDVVARTLSNAQYTTDFGTEMKLATFPPFCMQDFFPWIGPQGAGPRDEPFRDTHSTFDFDWAPRADTELAASVTGESAPDPPAFNMGWFELPDCDLPPVPAAPASPSAADVAFDFGWACGVGAAAPQILGEHAEAAAAQPQLGPTAQAQGEHAEPDAFLNGACPYMPEEHSARHSEHDELRVLTDFSLHIPGLQHILSNATDAMGASMLSWQAWLPKLKAVCDLLRRRYSRDRLKNTCFVNEPASLQWPLFEGFSAHVVQGRWGSIAEAVTMLLPLETALRYAWDIERFNYGRSTNDLPQPPAEESCRMDLGLLNDAITGEFFWAYTFMVYSLVDTVSHSTHWVMGCPCHSSRAAVGNATARAALPQGRSCPMAGRRAPEVASGELLSILRETWRVRASALRMESRLVLLPEASLAKLVTDFGLGRQAFMFYVEVKLVAFQQLPLLLIGLGCVDPRTARRVAVQCQALFLCCPLFPQEKARVIYTRQNHARRSSSRGPRAGTTPSQSTFATAWPGR